MIRSITLSGALLSSASPAWAQSPFEFREAAQLFERVGYVHHLEQYDPLHRGALLAHRARSPARQFDVDPDDPSIYRDPRWQGVLAQTDQVRRAGEVDIAERGYAQMLENLQRAQGESVELALLLDHIGEFHLEQRRFERAYTDFTDAVRVQRHALDSLLQAQSAAGPAARAPGMIALYRLHLMELLTRLGQIDIARGEWAAAEAKLAEATEIAKSGGGLGRDATTAVYFRSIVLEHKQAWSEAEQLWKDALGTSIGGKNALKEIAAFYARRGDLKAAADFARQAGSGVPNPRPTRPNPVPAELVARPWLDDDHSMYDEISDAAMREILALDAWTSQGPDAAAALLPASPGPALRTVFDHGSDAERLQMLEWQMRVVSLELSVLLAGAPSPERLASAYAAVAEIKGRYLATIADRVRGVDAERDNPRVQDPTGIGLLNELTAERERRAHRYVAALLGNQPLDGASVAADDNLERLLSTAVINDPSDSAYRRFPPGGPRVPSGAAFIDLIAWERREPDPRRVPQRVYGAFVMRAGQPLRYVELGPAAPIEADLNRLARIYARGRTRDLERVDVPTSDPEAILGRVSATVIRPLESLVAGMDELIIAPDGLFALVPLGIVPDARGEPWLAAHTITYVNSWRDLEPRATVDVVRNPPVIVANPDFDALLDTKASSAVVAQPFERLAHLQTEAQDVQRALRLPDNRVLTGRDARKATVESLQNPQILHFATHSDPFFGSPAAPSGLKLFEYPERQASEDPLLHSVIALAGANRLQGALEDGWLTGLEVANLHLAGTDLVVLSTCRSAQGTPTDGQGVQGLRAAFAMAGARALVMSLWPIDDEAGEIFMHLFYAHLADGPAAALRAAQLRLPSAAPQFKDVQYWGGYVASGDAFGPLSSPVGRTAAPVDTSTVVRNVASAPAPGASTDELLVHPACYRFATHEGSPPGETLPNFVQIKIGGTVRRLESSAHRVSYDLALPGNDILEKTFTPRVPNQPVERKQASLSDWAMTMTIEKTDQHSEITLQFGARRFPAEQRRTIRLEGPPGLLRSLDIPEVLPPLKAFTTRSDTFVTTQRVIDGSGDCTAEFWAQ